MGDGLMAIFNFPIKRERHAEAAMMAALDIQRQWKAALAASAQAAGAIHVGVGIHTGQVAIGEFSTIRSDFTAIGGTVNLAARLEAHTKLAVRGILVDGATHAALAGRVASEALGPVQFKGKAQAVDVFAIATPRSA